RLRTRTAASAILACIASAILPTRVALVVCAGSRPAQASSAANTARIELPPELLLLSNRRLHHFDPVAVRIVQFGHVLAVVELVGFNFPVVLGRRFGLEGRRDLHNIRD